MFYTGFVCVQFHGSYYMLVELAVYLACPFLQQLYEQVLSVLELDSELPGPLEHYQSEALF